MAMSDKQIAEIESRSAALLKYLDSADDRAEAYWVFRVDVPALIAELRRVKVALRKARAKLDAPDIHDGVSRWVGLIPRVG